MCRSGLNCSFYKPDKKYCDWVAELGRGNRLQRGTTLGGYGIVRCHDCGGGYTTLNTHQHSPKYMLKLIDFIICKLYLKNKYDINGLALFKIADFIFYNFTLNFFHFKKCEHCL